jgi:hypothetical protein
MGKRIERCNYAILAGELEGATGLNCEVHLHRIGSGIGRSNGANWAAGRGRIGRFKGIGRRIGRCDCAELAGKLRGSTTENWETERCGIGR